MVVFSPTVSGTVTSNRYDNRGFYLIFLGFLKCIILNLVETNTREKCNVPLSVFNTGNATLVATKMHFLLPTPRPKKVP